MITTEPAVEFAGVAYVTGRQIAERWPDVTPELLRAWCRPTRGRPPLLHPLTVGQLAAITGRPAPTGADLDAPARLPGPHGPQNLYPEHEVIEAEYTASASGLGRRRTARAA